MAHLLSIVNQQAPIDEEKLRTLCTHKNIWHYCAISREEFSSIAESKQLQMLRKFYFELLPSLSHTSASTAIDTSISSAFRNSGSITMTKVIEKDGDWSELSVSTSKKGKRKKSIQLWSDFGYFGTESCDFSIERANQPENTIFYVNQSTNLTRAVKKFTIMLL